MLIRTSPVRLFPHEVEDLSVLLNLFEEEKLLEATTWEIRYGLLLWLSLVSILPFALDRIDRHKGTGSSSSDVSAFSEIESIGRKYLSSASKERDGAVALLARYYSR